jgi:hypothetical protein
MKITCSSIKRIPRTPKASGSSNLSNHFQRVSGTADSLEGEDYKITNLLNDN